MTPTETAAILRHFNDWRRGHHDEQPDPRVIGEAINAAVEMIERLEAAEKERDNLRAKIEAMEKQKPAKYEFQGRDGKWYPFIDERHYETTLADGSWPIRALYALPGVQGEEE